MRKALYICSEIKNAEIGNESSLPSVDQLDKGNFDCKTTLSHIS
jgi:hypothetical protein